MQRQENVSLKNYSTMRLGGTARYVQEIHTPGEIGPAIDWAESQGLETIMIGEGSNIVWRDEGFNGLVLVNKIAGFEIQHQGEQSFVTAGAGEPWDSVVMRCVMEELSGIEQLSLVPGTAGATPIQNVGAYGREISDVLVSVIAYDKVEKKMVVIPKIDCAFGYRTSRFKTTDKGRFFISSITLTVTKNRPMPPFYGALDKYLKAHGMKQPTVQEIRDSVIDIRNSKLPNPKVVANCGSFFGNPIVDAFKLDELQEQYPLIPYWLTDDGRVKLSAAWLLEQLGLKGYHEPNTGMAIWDKQALVFVNEKAPNTASLLAFRDAIVEAVDKKFQVKLEQEPELI
jgi:UDP-N-acetylmuramate dehydrogenase